ncbi:MAG: rod shape-determining protein MreD [Bacteroidales bacterium]|nr:rod shape-determining protein MreD [Bacteroidales bacterium]MBK7627036.1 rod shape-determining protein MreD [Bacteroidales bacterium]
MINSIFRFGLIFILLILLQVLLFNNIQFSGYVNPYIYLMFIMLLPVEIPAWLLLLLSFITGGIIDYFSGSPGMHSSATVLAGFVRPYVLRLISPRDGYEPNSDPSMIIYGFRWFLIYTVFIVLVHHTALFYLEVFRFTDFFRTLGRVLLSSAFSITFILLFEFYRKGK